MQPQLDVLGVEVDAFPLTVVVAYLVALFVIVKRAREVGVPTQWGTRGVVVCVVGGLIGARVWNVVEAGGGGDALTSGGGLTWYGGLAGGALAGFAYAKYLGVELYHPIDVAAIIVPLVQAIGRIGCQLSGDGDYGTESDLPWAMGYPQGTEPTPPGVEVHPTPIYETLALGLIALWAWRNRERFAPYVLFGAYLVLSGIARFLVEFVRRNEDVAFGLTTPQLVSVGLVGAGALAIVAARRRPPVAAVRSRP